MRVTERGVLLTLIGLMVGLTLVFASMGGALGAYVYPGSTLVWAVAFTGAGLLILRARPAHAIGRLFLWAGLFSAANQLGLQVSETFMSEFAFDMEVGGYPAGTPPWYPPFDIVFGSGFVIVQVLVVAAIARFPTGAWVTRWVAWLFWLTLPFQVLSNFGFPPVAAVPVVIIFVTVVVKAWRSGPIERRQMAWVLIFTGLFLAIGIGSGTGLLPGWIVMTATVLVPAGFVLAITRYRLYEIDRIVSRTATYVVVVGLLIAVYFGLVLVLRSLLPVEGPLPVALSTLAVAFAFFPLARRVQGFVDRRFFRSRYDAASVVASFAAELRGTIDSDAVVDRAESVVGEVFAPESVGVWLAEGVS